MNDEYKYYFFFLLTDSGEKGDLLEPYAYTDEKKYAKVFIEERNMNLFVKKVKYLTKEDVNELANDYPTRILCEFSGWTFGYLNGKLKKTWYSFIIPRFEETQVINGGCAISTTYLLSYCFVDPYPFNDIIRKSLLHLHYTQCYNYVKKGMEYSVLPLEDVDPNDFQFVVDKTLVKETKETIHADLFSIFIHYFGNLLKYY